MQARAIASRSFHVLPHYIFGAQRLSYTWHQSPTSHSCSSNILLILRHHFPNHEVRLRDYQDFPGRSGATTAHPIPGKDNQRPSTTSACRPHRSPTTKVTRTQDGLFLPLVGPLPRSATKASEASLTLCAKSRRRESRGRRLFILRRPQDRGKRCNIMGASGGRVPGQSCCHRRRVQASESEIPRRHLQP